MMIGLFYFGFRDYTQSKSSGNVTKAWQELYNAEHKKNSELDAKYEKLIDKRISEFENQSNKNDTLTVVLNKALAKINSLKNDR